jgi:D-3-phosphoglycerate dehydrogenase
LVLKKAKVLITDPTLMRKDIIRDEEITRELKSLAIVVRALPRSDTEMLTYIQDADAIMLGDFPLSSTLIESARRLKIIARVGIGYDGVDVSAASKKKILVTNVPTGSSNAVAEHTILLMLSVARKIVAADASVRTQHWEEFFRDPPGFELAGKTLGIIGFGLIGSAVAERAKAFNMELLVFDPYRNRKKIDESGAQKVTLQELLRKSDVITIHTPLTPETKGLIGTRELKLMKKSAILVNTSRGGVLDENSLVEALREEKIAGAGLDVLASEPPELNNPLLHLSNVVLTPHCASFTIEVCKMLWRVCSDAVIRVLHGEIPQPPVNVINRELIPLLKQTDRHKTRLSS